MDKIEINMPIGSSEMTLKTAGKYCDKDIKVTSSLRTERGTFTPTENTGTFDVSGMSAGPRFIEIANLTPVSAVLLSEAGTAPLMPLTHAVWTGSLSKCPDVIKTGHVIYQVINKKGVPVFGSNLSKATLNEGKIVFDPTFADGLATMMFEAGVTYEWTAYFWDK